MASPLAAPDATRLVAGELEAVFLPRHGMLCASLRHRGDELLRRVEDLATAAARGSSAGIPLLHPWANRLDGPRYRAAGRSVELDVHSPLLHADENGLPMHGVPWAQLAWDLTASSRDRIDARLGAVAFDDGFTGLGDAPSFSIAGGGRRITVEFLEGFPFAQVFAPSDQGYVALEPMTAPTNALASGRDLRTVAPGASFCAAFRVAVAADC
jgi:galactose mutarotase-like enzyme